MTYHYFGTSVIGILYNLKLLKKNLFFLKEMCRIDEKNNGYWEKRVDKTTKEIQKLEKKIELLKKEETKSNK